MAKKTKLRCPVHNVKLVIQKTKFGARWDCPVYTCTVACWNGQTSTPANSATRSARTLTHTAFDSLWKGEWRLRLKLSRTQLYRMLARHLGLKLEKTHIGYFDIDCCRRTVEFIERLKETFYDAGTRNTGTDSKSIRENAT